MHCAPNWAPSPNLTLLLCCPQWVLWYSGPAVPRLQLDEMPDRQPCSTPGQTGSHWVTLGWVGRAQTPLLPPGHCPHLPRRLSTGALGAQACRVRATAFPHLGLISPSEANEAATLPESHSTAVRMLLGTAQICQPQ